MNTLTLEQLRAVSAAGGIADVMIKAHGNQFQVYITTHNGDAVLTKARSIEPRHFSNPFQAMSLLHTLGITNGHYDMNQYSTEKSHKTRPDRTQAMKQIHAAAQHDQWFREQVTQALIEADDPATEWVSHEEVLTSIERQRQSFKQRLKK